MQLHIYKDADEVTTALAEWITELIAKTLLTKDRFTIALSGGETPKTLYKKLAAEPYKEKIAWNKIHFFWGDERVIPFTDERNNAKMAYDNLLSQIKISEEQIHRINTGINPEKSAEQYEKILHQYFDNKENTFDLVLLGMGDDGHTLSLFPNSLVLFQNNKWVNAVDSPDKKMKRITLMPEVVNKSASVAFLITGSSKASSLKKVLEGKLQLEELPSQLIKPANNELHWFLDESAAQELRK
jgi:6-phosphogluconolactonase